MCCPICGKEAKFVNVVLIKGKEKALYFCYECNKFSEREVCVIRRAYGDSDRALQKEENKHPSQEGAKVLL